MPFDQQDLEALERHLSMRYGTMTSPKRSSVLMQLVAWILSTLGILGREQFLDHYTTIVGPWIFEPARPATLSADEAWRRILTTVHEHQHAVQFRAEGLVLFSVLYVLSARRRALWEAEAYTTEIELCHRFGRTARTPDEVASRLRDYALDAEHTSLARSVLEANAERVRKGELLTESARVSIDYLEERARTRGVAAPAPNPLAVRPPLRASTG